MDISLKPHSNSIIKGDKFFTYGNAIVQCKDYNPSTNEVTMIIIKEMDDIYQDSFTYNSKKGDTVYYAVRASNIQYNVNLYDNIKYIKMWGFNPMDVQYKFFSLKDKIYLL